MNSAQFAAIEDAINFIDREIRQMLDLDYIAKEVGISKYHLHRLFKSITGKSLMSYVRGRRLSMSLKELINTDLNIIDISNEYHFEHEQSYIRSFKQMFHMTPAQYRKEKCEVAIEQKIDTRHLKSIGQGLIIEPRTCIKPGFIIQGIEEEVIHERNLTDRDTNRQAELFQKSYLPQIADKADENVYYGYTSYTEHPQYSNYYTTSVEVSQKNPVEPPFVIHEIPMQEYAVFRYIGLHSPYAVSFATLRELYLYIGQWKLDTAYRQAAPYHFERMDLKICSDTYCEMDIYVPIRADMTEQREGGRN